MGILSVARCPGPGAALEALGVQFRLLGAGVPHARVTAPRAHRAWPSTAVSTATVLFPWCPPGLSSHARAVQASEDLRLCVWLPPVPGAVFSGVQTCGEPGLQGRAVGPEGHAGLSGQVSRVRGQLWELVSHRSPAEPQTMAWGRHSILWGQLSLEPGVRAGDAFDTGLAGGRTALGFPDVHPDQLIQVTFLRNTVPGPYCVQLRVTGGEATGARAPRTEPAVGPRRCSPKMETLFAGSLWIVKPFSLTRKTPSVALPHSLPR